MRLIFKNLNILRSTINAISRSSEVKEISESAGNNLSHLFDFSSFGVLWKEGPLLSLYQEESCPPSFSDDVVKNMVKIFSLLGEEPIDITRMTIQVEKRRLRANPMKMDQRASLKSHLTLPLSKEEEIIGCVSLNSDQTNAFDVQDLQFFSVIVYQMASTLEYFQKLSSMKNIAIYDTLTNIHNRRYFEERLRIETQRSITSKASLSLIMVDIDHFKKINDTFGHPEGDKILREIASLLKSSVRKRDTVARYGGEEFVLILPEVNLEGTSIIAERIRRLIESTPFDAGGVRSNITISMGISNFPIHQPKSDKELVKMADLALYEAKREGRNRVCIFNESLR